MAVLKTRNADRALVRKLGFEKTETHHNVYRLWLRGRLVARTYISHGGRELSRYHVSQMAKQLRLRTAEFVDAVNCPLTREDYCRILRERVPDPDGACPERSPRE
jgi:predicted deacetylase